MLVTILRYAKVRKSFGQPISSLYAIQEKIAGMSVRVDAARLLIHKAAMLKDAGKPFIKDAAQAKLYASEAATWCSHQAIQVHFYAMLIVWKEHMFVFLLNASRLKGAGVL